MYSNIGAVLVDILVSTVVFAIMGLVFVLTWGKEKYNLDCFYSSHQPLIVPSFCFPIDGSIINWFPADCWWYRPLLMNT